MKLESFNICQQVSEKNNIEYDLVKSINDIFFKSLNETVRKANNLIIDADVLGNFYYRQKKTADKLDSLKRGFFKKDFNDTTELEASLERILLYYKDYNNDKLNFKYEQFGEENHKAYLMGKESKSLFPSKKNKSK